MTAYIPVSHDNRGTADRPFGRVYVARARTLPFLQGSFGYGSHRDDKRLLAVWRTRDTPRDADEQTLSNVEAYLAREFPDLVGEVAG